MWQIEQTRLLKLPHVYLGYWIEREPEDGLQGQFRPHQVLQDGRWQRAPLRGLIQAFRRQRPSPSVRGAAVGLQLQQVRQQRARGPPGAGAAACRRRRGQQFVQRGAATRLAAATTLASRRRRCAIRRAQHVVRLRHQEAVAGREPLRSSFQQRLQRCAGRPPCRRRAG
jgi:hypothetical protein